MELKQPKFKKGDAIIYEPKYGSKSNGIIIDLDIDERRVTYKIKTKPYMSFWVHETQIQLKAKKTLKEMTLNELYELKSLRLIQKSIYPYELDEINCEITKREFDRVTYLSMLK